MAIPKLRKILVSPLPEEAKPPSERKPGIHFPSFVRCWNEGYYAEDSEFSRNFEMKSLCDVPDYRYLSQSVGAFGTFWDSSSSAETLPGNKDFWAELCNGYARNVYFVDKYFSVKELKRILLLTSTFPTDKGVSATALVILAAANPKDNDNYEDCKAKLRSRIHRVMSEHANRDAVNKVSFYILSEEDGLKIHDRFVVFEGLPETESCYWHFGASAGGMAGRLNAYTGPWMDKDQRFCTLVKKLLESADEVSKTEGGYHT